MSKARLVITAVVVEGRRAADVARRLRGRRLGHHHRHRRTGGAGPDQAASSIHVAAHKVANVLAALPKSQHPSARRMLAEIRDAEDRDHAVTAAHAFAHHFGAKWPKAVAKIIDDLDALLTFFDFPAEHWIHQRSTNPIESTFSTVRLRTRVTKGAGSRAAGLAMAFKLIESVQQRWRAVNGPHLVALVRAGATFEKGMLIERPKSARSGSRRAISEGFLSGPPARPYPAERLVPRRLFHPVRRVGPCPVADVQRGKPLPTRRAGALAGGGFGVRAATRPTRVSEPVPTRQHVLTIPPDGRSVVRRWTSRRAPASTVSATTT